MPSAPVLVQAVSTVYNTATTPKTTAAFDALAGDKLVAICESEDNSSPATISDNTGAALTWLQQSPVAVALFGWLSFWTADVPANRTGITVSFSRGATSARFGGTVFTVRAHGGAGAYAKANGTGTPGLSLPLVGANSLVLLANIDWNANDGASRASLENVVEPPQSITGTASTDTINCTGHGYKVGDQVRFSVLLGGAGLSSDPTLYYVIAAGLTANTFRVAATAGGSAVNFTTDITFGAVARVYEEDAYTLVSGGATFYVGHHPDSGSQATKTVGFSAPAGQKYSVAALEMLAPGTSYARSGATVAAHAPAGSVVRTRFRDRGGATVIAVQPSASVSRVNPITHTGTIAVGRIQPVRGGTITGRPKVAASRTVGSATNYTRSGATITAIAPAASRSVTPLGTTYARGGTVATGRIPSDRHGTTVVSTSLSGSWIKGSPGATFDRSGTVITGRSARTRGGTIAAGNAPAGSRAITPAGHYDRSGGNAGGAGQPIGLLLTLQAHPGARPSATRTLGSTVPARGGTIIASITASGSRARDLSRSAVVVTVVVTAASRVSSGNRNRNGRTVSQAIPAASRDVVKLSERTAALVAGQTLTGSAGTQLARVFAREATLQTQIVLSGHRAVRAATGKTYVFATITSGRVAAPEDRGVLVP